MSASVTYQNMPNEILQSIFSYLDLNSLLSAGSVCKHWEGNAENQIWKARCIRDWPDSDQPETDFNWKFYYEQQCLIDANIRANKVGQRVFYKNFVADSRIHILMSKGELFVRCSDNIIEVLSPKAGNYLRTLLGYDGQISAFCADENKIFLGADKEIKVLDSKTGHCLQTLLGHTESIDSLCTGAGRLYSGGPDGIRVWDIMTGDPVQTVQTDSSVSSVDRYKKHVGALFFFNSMIFSGTGDKLFGKPYEIHVWNAENGALVKILEQEDKDSHDATNWVTNLCAYAGRLFACLSHSSAIRVWNIEDGQSLPSLVGRMVPADEHAFEPVQTMLAHNGKLYSGDCRETIRVWEIKTSTCLFSFKVRNKESGVYSLCIHQGMLFSAVHTSVYPASPASMRVRSRASVHVWDFLNLEQSESS